MTTASASAAPTDSPDSAPPILELRGINKSFGPVHVLRDVDLSIAAGEVTALVGDNGAGKSTIVKCIGGTHPTDSGSYLFEGSPVKVDSPRAAGELGVEIVYQDLALCDNLDIVQNMFLGRERTRRMVLDEATMEQMAAETLAGLSVRGLASVRQRVASLSGGQRQTVAIAKAVLWNRKVVVLDEPTAALGVAQTAQVLELVRRLADNGLAVLLVSHNMNDVFAVADRIAVLYLGRMTAQVRASDVTHSQVVELITTGRGGTLRDAADARGKADPPAAGREDLEGPGRGDPEAPEAPEVPDAPDDSDGLDDPDERPGDQRNGAHS